MIEVADLCKSYTLGDQSFPVLRGIDLKVERGDFVALTGASGSGKSTLMNILGCLDTPDSGLYRLGGRDVAGLGESELARERNLRIGFVFQSFHLLPRASALANVALPLIYRGVPPARRREAALAALTHVGLEQRVNHKPSELSGGQRQRVAIARALIGDPQIILADEPTGNLDSHTSKEIMALLTELNQKGLTLLVVTHDPEIAGSCRRVVRMQDGLIVSDGQPMPASETGA